MSLPSASSNALSSAPGPDPHEVFAQSLVGTTIGGRYVVDRVLGKGGMGLVVSAHYVDLDQKVAIKLMFPEHAANETLARRFKREAKVAAKVRSPNLVRVTDIGSLESGVPYLVMELLAGRDLDAELAARGVLPVEDAVQHVLETAAGLAELHALGIVHRDLKPGNLFLAEVAGGRELKILDYGISKDSASTASSLTVTDALIGTPSHMSPEQIKTPKEVDTRSDIWSLGVILYELLSYKLPYELEGSTVGELFGLVLFSDPIPLRQRRPELPEALEAVVMKCLRRDRNERWASVAELAEALAPFARPESRHRVSAIAKVLAHAPSSPKMVAAKESDPRQKATVMSGTAKVAQVDEVIEPSDDGAVAASPEAQIALTIASGRPARAAVEAEPTSQRSTLPETRGKGSNGMVLAAAIGAVVVLGIGGFFALRTSSPPATGLKPVETAPALSAEPATPPSTASAVPEPVSTQVVVPVPSATVTGAAKGVRTASPAVPAGEGKSKNGFIVRTLPSGAPPAPAPAPAPAPKTDDLILDRK